MIEMTRVDGIMFGIAIVVPAAICLVWMAIEDIRSYLKRKNIEGK